MTPSIHVQPPIQGLDANGIDIRVNPAEFMQNRAAPKIRARHAHRHDMVEIQQASVVKGFKKFRQSLVGIKVMFPGRVVIDPRTDAASRLGWQLGLGFVGLPDEFWYKFNHHKLRILESQTT